MPLRAVAMSSSSESARREVDPVIEPPRRDPPGRLRDPRERLHHPRENRPHDQRQRRKRDRDRPGIEPDHLAHRLPQVGQRRAHEQERAPLPRHTARRRLPPAEFQILSVRSGHSGCQEKPGGSRWDFTGVPSACQMPANQENGFALRCRPTSEGMRSRMAIDGLQSDAVLTAGKEQAAEPQVGLEERVGGEPLLGLERTEPGPELRVDVADEDVLRDEIGEAPDRDRDQEKEQAHPERRPPAQRVEEWSTHRRRAVR